MALTLVLARMPTRFMDGRFTMRKSIPWLLVLSFSGCGGGDVPSPTTEAPARPAPVTLTPAAANAPRKISPEEAVKLAREFVQKQDLKSAMALLNQAILSNPKLVEAYVVRGTIFADQALHPRAVMDFNKVIELEPGNAKYRNTRGYFLLVQQKYDEAMEDFSQAIASDANYPQPLNNRGLVRIAQEDFVKAVQEFNAALRIDGKYVDALNNRGFAFTQAGKLDEAVADFTKVIELDGKYINAWNNRGQAHAKAGRHVEAIADFTQAIALDASIMEYYRLRADSHTASGNAELARADLNYIDWSYDLDALNRNLNAGPKDPQNWVARGHHLAKVARWAEAMTNYEDALKLDTDYVPAKIGRASVLFQQGQVDEALTICNAIVKADGSRDAHSLRGDIYFAQGQFDPAIADFRIAQRFDAIVAQAYLKRSEKSQASGDIQQASADLHQAIRIDPSLKTADFSEPVPEKKAPGAFPADEE